MEKYKRYYGVGLFIAGFALILYLAWNLVAPAIETSKSLEGTIVEKTNLRSDLLNKQRNVKEKIAKLQSAVNDVQKKIYSPVESDLDNETLFFTLYNDVIDMIHANSIKIKSVDYSYNPSSDSFIAYGKDIYFVCDLNLKLISNYKNLGKFIEDVYKYQYYIRIMNLDVKPFAKDKKILISNITLRLYAHTSPDAE